LQALSSDAVESRPHLNTDRDAGDMPAFFHLLGLARTAGTAGHQGKRCIEPLGDCDADSLRC